MGDKKEKKFEFKDFPEVGLVVNITFWVILIAVCFVYFVLARNYIADTYYRKYLVSQNDTTLLEKAIKFNDNQSDYHTTLARGYLMKLSEEVSKSEPNNESVVSLVALSIMEGRRAIETAPRRITSHETLGVVYREVQGLAQGAVDWGVKALQEALKEEPNNPILMTELAKLYLSQEKTEQAKLMFEKALELKPEYTPAGIQLALIKESEGSIDEAITLLEDIVKNDQFSIDGHFHLGRLYFNSDRLEEAEAQFISVISIFPNHSNALYSLGTLYEKKGDLTEALLLYNKVLDLNPNNEIIESKIKELTITSDEPETENQEL